MSRLIATLLVGLLLFGLNEGQGNESWSRHGTQLGVSCFYNVDEQCWCCKGDANKESCNNWCIAKQKARWGTCGYNDQLKRECCVCFEN